jgi:hypothetical protein
MQVLKLVPQRAAHALAQRAARGAVAAGAAAKQGGRDERIARRPAGQREGAGRVRHGNLLVVPLGAG